MNLTETETDAIVRLAAQPKLIPASPCGAPETVLALPPGWTAKDFRHLLPEPNRQTGFKCLADVDALARYIAHNAPPETEIFTDRKATIVRAVFNPNGQKAGWGDWGAALKLELDDSAKEWSGSSNKTMSQAQFSEFLRAHSGDIVSMPAAALLDFVENLEVKSGVSATYKTNPQTGAKTLLWAEDVQATTTVPSTITIRIPIFYGQESMVAIDARLAFRATKEGLEWRYVIDDWRLAVDAAWKATIIDLARHESMAPWKDRIFAGVIG